MADVYMEENPEDYKDDMLLHYPRPDWPGHGILYNEEDETLYRDGSSHISELQSCE